MKALHNTWHRGFGRRDWNYVIQGTTSIDPFATTRRSTWYGIMFSGHMVKGGSPWGRSYFISCVCVCVWWKRYCAEVRRKREQDKMLDLYFWLHLPLLHTFRICSRQIRILTLELRGLTSRQEWFMLSEFGNSWWLWIWKPNETHTYLCMYKLSGRTPQFSCDHRLQGNCRKKTWNHDVVEETDYSVSSSLVASVHGVASIVTVVICHNTLGCHISQSILATFSTLF